MKRIACLSLILSFFLVPLSTYAAEVQGLRSYTLRADDQVDSNVYVAARDILVEGSIMGDLVGLGGSVTSRGHIYNDTTVLGGSVYASSTIEGDVRIIGGTVRIGGVIDGDVLVAGATVEILPNTIITGDVILLGGQVNVQSAITNKIKIIAWEAIINSVISGTADITSPTVVIGSTADLRGKMTYFSHREARIENGAIVGGQLFFNQIEWIKDTGSIQKVVDNFLNFWTFLQFINTLLLSFILLFVFKPSSKEIVQLALLQFGKMTLLGLLSLICIPILAVIFIASLFALPVGVIFILGFVAAYILSTAYTAMIIGSLIKKYILRNNDEELTFSVALMGAVFMILLHFIPFVGDTLRVIFFLVAFGAMSHKVYKTIR